MRRPPSRLVLLGHPVSHSLSPHFQNAALRRAGIPVSYEALDVEAVQLSAVLCELAAEGAAGNVTVPHKEATATLCGRLTPLASRVGAVNTFWVDDVGALVGDNTDVGGLQYLVEELLGEAPEGMSFGIVGAGGAAAAALAAVETWKECHALVWARRPARAEGLCTRFADVAQPVRALSELAEVADVVVNATPVGLHRDECPLPPTRLKPDAAVVDLVYRRGGTYWVRAARACGLRAADGLSMLLEQGALAFERWFGLPAPRDVMRDAVL